ncbi:MAG: AsmA family protein [Pseudomonadota bacterium]
MAVSTLHFLGLVFSTQAWQGTLQERACRLGVAVFVEKAFPMLRRLVLGLFALVALLAAGLLALPSVISSQTVRQEVARQISDLTGRAVTLRGDRVLKVLPNLSVELSDLVIEGNLPGVENALVVAETLRGAVRPLPLLFGRIELSSFEMTRPTFRFVRNGEGVSNWVLREGELMSALDPNGNDTRSVQLGRLRITDGTLHFIDEVRRIEETVTSATVTLTWPSSSTRAALSGSAIWRGEAVDISASLDQPAALTQTGSTSGVVLAVQSAPLQLDFDGTLSPGSFGGGNLPWQASGRLGLEGPSLRRMAAWLGADIAAGSTFSAFSLDANINSAGLSADLTDITLTIDGNEAEGVLTFDAASMASTPDQGSSNETNLEEDGQIVQPDTRTALPEPASLQGTLDFAQLDLSPYIDSFRPTTTEAAPGGWQFLVLPDLFAWQLALDVRFSSRQVMMPNVTLGETAGSVLLTDERFLLGIAEAEAYGGFVRGGLEVLRGTEGPQSARTILDVGANDIALEPMLSSWFEDAPVSGVLDLTSRLEGQGDTVTALFATLNGEANATLTSGLLNGIDLDQLGESIAGGSFDVAAFSAAGQTRVDMLSGTFTTSRGYLRMSDLSLETDTATVTASGWTAFADQSIRLAGSAAVSQDEDGAVAVPFAVRGTWSDPQILPNLDRVEPLPPEAN